MIEPQNIRYLSLRIYRSLCSQSWTYTRRANIRGLWKIDTRLPIFSTICVFRRMAAPASGSLVLFIRYCLTETVYPIFILFIYPSLHAIPYIYIHASFFYSTPCSYSRTENHQIGSFSVPSYSVFLIRPLVLSRAAPFVASAIPSPAFRKIVHGCAFFLDPVRPRRRAKGWGERNGLLKGRRAI